MPEPPAQPEQPPLQRPRRNPAVKRRRRTFAVLAAVVAVLVAVGVVLLVVGVPGGSSRTAEPLPPDKSTSPPSPWLSGASGEAAASGEFAEWRGEPLGIVGTWVDNNDAMVKLAQLQPGKEYGSWDGPIDIAVGAFDDDESWKGAADGEYDDRWRESLTGIEAAMGDREGPVYIRFAHEMNGDWYPWAVDKDDRESFITAWKRFRALQQEIFPESQLVFCVNRESVGTGFDWRDSYPGDGQVDVMGVDYYNQFPYVETKEGWESAVKETDKHGAPKGLEQHLAFAEEVGLPLAVPEWSGNADNGDSPVFIESMHQFFDENAGTGSGDLLYEILFNRDRDELRWLIYGERTRMPDSAEAYQKLW